MSQSEVIKILQRYITLLNTQGIPVEQAILFGSYARQDANENSDIDVMIISRFFEKEDIASKQLAWKFVRMIDRRIEPVTIGPERFLQDGDSQLISQVKKEGIPIQLS